MKIRSQKRTKHRNQPSTLELITTHSIDKLCLLLPRYLLFQFFLLRFLKYSESHRGTVVLSTPLGETREWNNNAPKTRPKPNKHHASSTVRCFIGKRQHTETLKRLVSQQIIKPKVRKNVLAETMLSKDLG